MHSHDHWSSMNDPFADDGYGAIPFIVYPILLATGGWMTVEAAKTYRESTNVNDIARFAAEEKRKVDSKLNSAQGDAVRSIMYQGAENTREAAYIAAFWLWRAARIAKDEPGSMGDRDRMIALADQYYNRASGGMGWSGSDDQQAIASYFRNAQSLVYAWAPTVADVLESLQGTYSTAVRRSYQEQTSLQSTLVRPTVQTARDIPEAAAAPFVAIADAAGTVRDTKNWINENKGKILAGAVGLIIVNMLIAARAGRAGRSKSSTAASPSPRRRTRTR